MADQSIDLRRVENFKINGYTVDATVFEAIVNPENRVLWRFQTDGNRIVATPIDERHVIWLDPDVAEAQDG